MTNHQARLPPGSHQMPKVRIGAILQAKVLRLLVDGPHSVLELEGESGVHEKTLRGYLKELHAQKLVYVHDWLPNSRGTRDTRMWHWGPGKRDAPRPKVSQAVRTANYRARLKVHGMLRAPNRDAQWNILIKEAKT